MTPSRNGRRLLPAALGWLLALLGPACELLTCPHVSDCANGLVVHLRGLAVADGGPEPVAVVVAPDDAEARTARCPEELSAPPDGGVFCFYDSGTEVSVVLDGFFPTAGEISIRQAGRADVRQRFTAVYSKGVASPPGCAGEPQCVSAVVPVSAAP